MSSQRSYRGIVPRLSSGVYIEASACVIGDVTLQENVSIWPMVVIRGDVNHIVIGANSNIQDGAVLHVSRATPERPDGYPLIIGEQVTVGHKAMLHGCSIGDRVLIGMGAIILDGVRIDPDVIIAAGSVVPPGKHLHAGFLYMGSPARLARPLTESELSMLTQSAANYVSLKDEYLAEAFHQAQPQTNRRKPSL